MGEGFQPLTALGLMTGTSMDGIDAAVLRTDGVTIADFGPAMAYPLAADYAQIVRSAFGWDEAPQAEALVLAEHRATVAAMTAKVTPDLLGFHGQTVAHDPAQGRTRQLGDGAALARETGIKTVWDFRSADVLSGGEGAPLAPFFHHACIRRVGLAEPVAVLNIGGVANVTWVDPRVEHPESTDALLAFDTGPGNALLDDFINTRLGQSHDPDGDISGIGVADDDLVAQVMAHEYIQRTPPKSLDRNNFHDLLERVSGMSTENGAATLAAITAATIAASVPHMPHPPSRWLICGGGRHNRTIMRMIGTRTNAPVEPVEVLGLDGDMLEAQAFAYLAVRVIRGLPTSSSTTTGCRMPVSGGRISTP